MFNHKIFNRLLIFASIFIFSCKGMGQKQSQTDSLKIAKQRMDSLNRIATRTARTYHEMDDATLFAKLLEQSKQRKEPFNSLAFRELQTRKEVNANTLVAMVRDNSGADGLLPLLLLRKMNNPVYLKLPMPLRVSVLTGALPQWKYYNSWGIPPFYLQDASRAMMECDSTAFVPLFGLLHDLRPAPVFGSQEYMLYMRYQYRVCDYALFFIQAMRRKERFEMPVTAAGRDSLIRALGK